MKGGFAVEITSSYAVEIKKAENVRQYYKDLSRSRFFLDWLF